MFNSAFVSVTLDAPNVSNEKYMPSLSLYITYVLHSLSTTRQVCVSFIDTSYSYTDNVVILRAGCVGTYWAVRAEPSKVWSRVVFFYYESFYFPSRQRRSRTNEKNNTPRVHCFQKSILNTFGGGEYRGGISCFNEYVSSSWLPSVDLHSVYLGSPTNFKT